MNLTGVPLFELRRRYGRGGDAPTPALLVALRSDPRAGAHQLADALGRRRAKEVAERRRLRSLFSLERELGRAGVRVVAGVDEVGVGPLAGPVVAAAVVLPPDAGLPGLDDSKRLVAAARERLDGEIRRLAPALSVAWATPQEIDRLNVYQAGLLAMRRAVEGLELRADQLLVDARTIPEVAVPQRAVFRGDACIASIAAASVVAKVYRDAWMRDLGRRYPGYGFAHNAGYATAEHRRALERRGPTPVHRYSFAPVREAERRRRRRA